ncbi:MAG: NADPH-dependent reductase [Sporomusa sp.]|jgi:multimeric flavodoxin WrbA|nr:NADPH-dependent reductase [Sporomusa sp.]
MKIIAFNGSPRKKWNTATLLNKALEGAASQGAKIELIHLYDLNYKGCISCFACKTKGGKSYGKCPIQDDLAPIFKKVEEADAIILGSPIYLGRVTGEMGAFMDRLIFQYSVYSDPPQSLFPRKIPTGFIYTMNATEEQVKEMGYSQQFAINENMLRRIFGNSETLSSLDTYQFDDYSKMVAPRFDPEKKAKRRKEEFPVDCNKAFELGVRLAQQGKAINQ